MSAFPFRSGLAGCLLATSLVLGGLSLKTLRYAGHREPSTATVATRIQALMAADNWAAEPPVVVADSLPLVELPFRKSGCAHTATITVINANAGVESYIRQSFNDDVVFIAAVGSNSAAEPPGTSIARSIAQTLTRLITNASSSAKVLAIAPAPRPDDVHCRLPTQALWSDLLHTSPSELH